MIDVTRNTPAHRFELLDDGRPIGVLDYSYAPGATILEHIEVDEAYSGQGLASRFTQEVLGQMRAAGESMIPECPFVKQFLAENPEFQDVVADREQ